MISPDLSRLGNFLITNKRRAGSDRTVSIMACHFISQSASVSVPILQRSCSPRRSMLQDNKMRKFVTILSLFALLVSITASLAHAHMNTPDTQTHIASDMGHGSDDTDYSDCCDMACGGCGMHHHHHVAYILSDSISAHIAIKDKQGFGTDLTYLSSLVYGLKRPPKA